MTIPPFVPTIERGRLYGRGSCDVKGSMAAMLLAFARLVRERPRGPPRCCWPAPSTRNSRITGSSRLSATDDHGADLAIVAEPTLLDIVHCHKGVLALEDPHRRESPATARRPSWVKTRSTGWRRSSKPSKRYAATLKQITPHEILGSPTHVGRTDRRGRERQRRSRLVRNGSRSPVDSR